MTIENTHSLSMGQPLTAAFTQSVADIAAERGVPLFVDGARLFNASVALGVPARALVPEGRRRRSACRSRWAARSGR